MWASRAAILEHFPAAVGWLAGELTARGCRISHKSTVLSNDAGLSRALARALRQGGTPATATPTPATWGSTAPWANAGG